MKFFFTLQIITALILLILCFTINYFFNSNFTLLGTIICCWIVQSISCCIYFNLKNHKKDILSKFKWNIMGLLSFLILLDIISLILFFSNKIITTKNTVFIINIVLSLLFLFIVLYALIFYIKKLRHNSVFKALFRDTIIAYIPIVISFYYNFQSIFLSRHNIVKFTENTLLFWSFNIEQISIFLLGFLLLMLFMTSFYVVKCKRSNFILVSCFLINNAFYFLTINISDINLKVLFELQPLLNQFIFTMAIILGTYFNLKDMDLIDNDMNDEHIHLNNIWPSIIIAVIPIFLAIIYMVAAFVFKINLNIYKYLFLTILSLSLVLYRDIVVRKENTILMKTIRKHSKTDFLTGLNNRSAFSGEICHWNCPYTLFFFDIKKFKDINDIYGHDIGDLVLKLVSNDLEKIKKSIIYKCSLCRYGGDEFIFAIYTTNKNYINYLSKLFLEEKKLYIKDLNLLIHFRLNVGYSINKNNKPLDIILKEADYAMYKSKLSDTPKSFEFNHKLNKEYLELNTLKKDLKNAILNEELFLMFQPKICIKTNNIIGFESLCRWQHKTLGYIPPGKFIKIAEHSGIIQDLDLYVFKKACEFQKKLLEKNIHLNCSINLSLKSLRDLSIINSFSTIVKELNLSFNNITLELLESIVMDENLFLLNQIDNLKKLGFSISIDDFGTEYSSLNRLFKIPFDELKIPKDFVEDTPNTNQLAILNSVAYLSKQLKVSTVVEGIETREQLNLFKSLGFDNVQGYYYSKPLTKKKFIEYLKVFI